MGKKQTNISYKFMICLFCTNFGLNILLDRRFGIWYNENS